MGHSLRGLLTIAMLLCAHAAAARDVPIENLRRFEMPPYSIFAADEAEARQAATYAAQVDQVLYRKFQPEPRLTTPPTSLLLLSGKQLKSYLARGKAKVTPARAAHDSNYLLLPSGVGAHRLRRAVYHQLAHLYLETQMETLPFWFEEGFALMIETLGIEGDEAVIGRQRFDFQDRATETLREGNRVMDKEGARQTVPDWISLSRVFGCDDTCSEHASERERHLMRREQWVTVHRLMIGEPTLGKQLEGYLELWRQQVPVDQAMQQSLGNPDQLDRSTRAYASRENLPVERTPFHAPAVQLVENGAFRHEEVEVVLASLPSMHWPALN